ncbi:MAG: hypothetical protein GY903_25390 [Fuerstiella sp.]|nr:hypothetical protein [Fuerstiella sp.]MCP4857831.1 hypothetical protein [Fuerstiella sp.]
MTEPNASSDENLRRVREKVMHLAREIEKMSGEDIPPNIFFQEFLNRVVTAIGAKGGAVWLLQDGGRLGLVAEVDLDQTGLKEIPGALQVNEKLLLDVLQTGEAKTLIHGQGVDLPTEHVMVLSALHKEKDCVGVVQLFQRADVPEKARSGYMQFLEQMCGYASRYVEGKRRNASMTDDLKSQFWTDFEQFTLRIQRSLEEQEVADASASDGRPLLGCDRVSVISRKGRSVKVRAVSGQSTVNPRANLITSMTRLARRVIDMGETLTYAGKIENLPPQIEKPLANFVQESGSRMIMIVPMFENEVLVREQGEEAELKRRKKRHKAIGCIVIEQVAESEPVPQLEERAELLADHIGAALWNSRVHGRIIGRSVFKLMGRVTEWFQGRKLAITTMVLAVIAGIVAAMTMVRLPYPVDADGKLMPVEQHAVFALWDGEIVEIEVPVDDSGELRVEQQQVLMTLYNDEIEEDISNAKTEINKQVELRKIASNARKSAEQLRNKEEVHRLQIELETIAADHKIAQNKLEKILDRKDKKLKVRAPATGVIPDFKRMEVLQDRPVRQGDHLFDVMNDNGPWHMELLVEEKRMGHLLRAIEENRARGGEGMLECEFTMVSLPESKFKCRLVTIATRSTTDSELGTAFELIAEGAEGTEIPTRQIGSEVSVRIYCSDCTLAFWLFGDVVEFVQRNMWWF